MDVELLANALRKSCAAGLVLSNSLLVERRCGVWWECLAHCWVLREHPLPLRFQGDGVNSVPRAFPVDIPRT